MAYLAHHRRANQFRKHAHELTASAEREWNDDRRRHMLDLAATYQRVADQMAPQPPASPASPASQVFSESKP